MASSFALSSPSSSLPVSPLASDADEFVDVTREEEEETVVVEEAMSATYEEDISEAIRRSMQPVTSPGCEGYPDADEVPEPEVEECEQQEASSECRREMPQPGSFDSLPDLAALTDAAQQRVVCEDVPASATATSVPSSLAPPEVDADPDSLADSPMMAEPTSAPHTPARASSSAINSNGTFPRVKLSCAVCRDAFTVDAPQDSCEIDHRPRLLQTCMHSVCTHCCRDIIDKANATNAQFKCPLDHTAYYFRSLDDVPFHMDALASVKKLNQLDEYRVGLHGVGEDSFGSSTDHTDCDECAHPAEWYCTRCDASLCDLHASTNLQSKHRSMKLVLPVSERAAFLARASAAGAASLCQEHMLPESLLCTLDQCVCCQTCSLHSDAHREHSGQVITIVEAAEANTRRMHEAINLPTHELLQKEIDHANKTEQSIAVFESETVATIQDEFQRLEDRLRVRKDQLLKEVAEKAEFIRSSVNANQRHLSQLLHRLTLTRDVAQCLLPMRSYSSLSHSADALHEFESIQSAYASFLLHGDRPTIPGTYCSTFKPVMKELLKLGVVPDLRSEGGADEHATFTPLGWQSRILTQSKEVDALKTMICASDVRCKLLYRATRDGFTAAAFHERCDKSGPTLTLIRCRETGHIFGAVVIPEYESCDAGAYMIDPTGLSFIFSLTNAHRRPYKLINLEHERAMYVKTGQGPMIGGRDISMSANFDQSNNTCMPSAYGSLRTFDARSNTVTPEVTYDAHLLAGTPTWSCAEMEVYALAPFGLLQLLRSSHILRMLDLPHMRRFFGRQVIGSPRLLYRASRDGFTAADFRRTCTDSGATLTLVKVAGSSFVFGAYAAVPFPQVPHGRFFTPVADESMSSFLFSLINAHQRPLKFHLKQPSYALYSHASHGPVFGGGPTHSPDIILGVKDESGMSGRAATLPFHHPIGNSINTPSNYAIDDTVEIEAGLPSTRQSNIVHDRKLLAGKALFQIQEMEVYAMR